MPGSWSALEQAAISASDDGLGLRSLRVSIRDPQGRFAPRTWNFGSNGSVTLLWDHTFGGQPEQSSESAPAPLSPLAGIPGLLTGAAAQSQLAFGQGAG